VLWSRLGVFDVAEYERLLWEDRALVEWRAFVYPIEQLPLLRARMRAWPPGGGVVSGRIRDWLDANASFRAYVLRELGRRGPLASREIEDRSEGPWHSEGWTGNRNVAQMLGFLAAQGRVAVVGRRGGQRLWDLASRWYPPTPRVGLAEAERRLAAIAFRALGIARRGPGAIARVAGTEGTWRVDPGRLEDTRRRASRRITLLSPFDRLIHDRPRTLELFGFDYRMEIYVPKARRRYGYFVLPVLAGDRLIGRIDPEFDRATRLLRVHAVHWEPGQREVSLDAPLRRLARFLGAERISG